MFIRMKEFMSGNPVVVNTDKIIKISGLKENKGSILTMSDGVRAVVGHDLNELCKEMAVTSIGEEEPE